MSLLQVKMFPLPALRGWWGGFRRSKKTWLYLKHSTLGFLSSVAAFTTRFARVFNYGFNTLQGTSQTTQSNEPLLSLDFCAGSSLFGCSFCHAQPLSWFIMYVSYILPILWPCKMPALSHLLILSYNGTHLSLMKLTYGLLFLRIQEKIGAGLPWYRVNLGCLPWCFWCCQMNCFFISHWLLFYNCVFILLSLLSLELFPTTHFSCFPFRAQTWFTPCWTPWCTVKKATGKSLGKRV